MNDFSHNLYFILPSTRLFPLEGIHGNVLKSELPAVNLAIAAQKEYQSGNLQAALSQYSEAIDLFPKQPFFYACRCLINKKLGDAEGGFYDYQTAKNMDFNYHHFLEWKDNEGEMVESEELVELNKQLIVNDSDAQLYVNRAMLHVQHYGCQEAVEDFERAFALQPKAGYLVSSAAVYMRMVDYENAFKKLNAALQADQELIDAYLYRAKLYQAIGENELAEQDFNFCVRSKPQHKLYYEERAGYYEKNSRWKDAIGDYTALIALDTEDFFPYVMRADLYEKTAQVSLAIGDYDKAISLNPYYSDLYQYRANLRAQAGDEVGAAQDKAKYEELENED